MQKKTILICRAKSFSSRTQEGHFSLLSNFCQRDFALVKSRSFCQLRGQMDPGLCRTDPYIFPISWFMTMVYLEFFMTSLQSFRKCLRTLTKISTSFGSVYFLSTFIHFKSHASILNLAQSSLSLPFVTICLLSKTPPKLTLFSTKTWLSTIIFHRHCLHVCLHLKFLNVSFTFSLQQKKKWAMDLWSKWCRFWFNFGFGAYLKKNLVMVA